MSVTVVVPASSANLGSGFDALGLAFGRHVRFTTEVDEADATDEHHLAIRAFRVASGTGHARVEADFPGGRGMGFSAAARVAGLCAARLQHGDDLHTARAFALVQGAALEGHADNVAASVRGGVVAVAGDAVVSVPLGAPVAVVLWVPDEETSTKTSRRLLPDTISFTDAVFNVGRVAVLVAALAAGDTRALRTGTEDRMHQDRRYARVPTSKAAHDALIEAGAWCAWLSGSGPSVAAFCDPSDAERITANLPEHGRAIITDIDTQGTRLS